MEFSKKVAVISGGNNGIGEQILKDFKNNGATVLCIDKDNCKVDCDYYFKGDIGDKKTLDLFCEEIINRYKKVDFIINNACISKGGLLSDCSYEDFVNVLQVGAVAPYYLTLKLKDYLSDNAVIVNIGSTRSQMSMPDTESYTAAKGAITSLTHSLAVSLKGKVRVNCISPGWIDAANSKLSESDEKQHLVERVGKPSDISQMVLFLCSEKSSFITGQNFIVDGGMTKQMIYSWENGWGYII